MNWAGGWYNVWQGQWKVELEGITGTPQQQTAAVANRLAYLSPDYHVVQYLGANGEFLVEGPAGQSADQARARLNSAFRVGDFEPNFLITSLATPNDTFFDPYQWGLNNYGQFVGGPFGSGFGTPDADIDAPEAWNSVTGSFGSAGVIVADLDTGIDYTHPDLVPNLFLNQREIPAGLGLVDADADGIISFRDLNAPANAGKVPDANGNGLIDGYDVLHDPAWADGTDNDGNGKVDDLFGWSFYSNTNDPNDLNGHGTHTAGTVGAKGNNGLGVTGVNWDVQLLPLQIFGGPGGSYAGDAAVVSALNYMRTLKDEGFNVRLSNNSWGGGGPSYMMYQAIDAQRAAPYGMLFVAAAGNSGSNNDFSPFYPAGFNQPIDFGGSVGVQPGLDNIISVAASTNTEAPAFFSNYGHTSVQLFAPGLDIASTYPVAFGSYAFDSGTSMATPHVTGAAALGWAKSPGASYLQIKNAILNGVDVEPAYTGLVSTSGRLNLVGMLNHLGLSVTSTTPAAGSVVSAPPSDFVVNFSDAYDPATVDATDLTVNGIAASSYTLTDGDTVTFHFASSPVTSQGLQTMAIAAGSIDRLGDGDGVDAFSATFRYDAVLLQVTSTNPPSPSGVFTLPGPFTYDVNFNEPVGPASVQAGDLQLSGLPGAAVTGVTVLPGNTTARFTIGGITAEGTLSVTVPAGAVTDQYGNPGAAFSAAYTVDVGTAAFPVPLTPVNPVGSLIYDPTQPGVVQFAGDIDKFTLSVDAGQTITLLLTTSASLQGTLSLAAGSATVASATAAGAGQKVVIQTVKVPGQLGGSTPPTSYTITVGGAGGTTGAYTLEVVLNAALEGESVGGPADDTTAAAQDLTGSFVLLNSAGTSSTQPGRAAVLGTLTSTAATVPGFLKNQENFNGNAYPFDLQPFGISSMRYQQIYSASEFATGGAIDELRFRRYIYSSPFTNLQLDVQINLGYAATTVATASPNFADNIGAGLTTVYDGPLTLSSTGSGSPNPFDVIIHVADTFHYDPSRGDLLVDFHVRSASFPDATYFSASGFGEQSSTQRIFSFDVNATQGNVGFFDTEVRPYGLVTQFGFEPDTDTYKVSLSAGQSATVTATSLDGGALRVALLDSAGKALAVGTANQTSAVAGLISNFVAQATGTYYVQLTSDTGARYSLVVTRSAEFDTEANNSMATAQDLISPEVAGQRWALGEVEPPFSGLYATGNDGNELITIDKGTGTATVVGPFGTSSTYTAAFTPDGTLWTFVDAFDSSQVRLATVDPKTGLATPVGVPDWTGSPVLAMDADAQGNLYAGNWNGTFFSVNKTTGQMTPIGFMGFFDAMDFAFDNNGTLWALDDGFNLYTIDPTTGAGTFRTSIQGLNAFAMGLMVDPTDNTLYATTYTFDSNLYRIDRTTGVATEVGPVGVPYAHGGDFAPPHAETDFYKVTVDDSKPLQIATQTPAGLSGQFVNNFDPVVRVYDVAGHLVASDDNGDPDGRNVKLTYKVPKGKGGTYYIEVAASGATPQATAGEYVLSVKGATGALPPFQVAATDPADGARIRVAPTAVTVDFNDTVLLTSLQASDLTIDGVPASGLTVVDGDTAVFTVPGPLAEGKHTIRIKGGAIQDIQGTPIDAFAGSFVLDLTPPRIVGVSLQEGDVAPAGDLTYKVQFSEPMRTANLDNSDFSLFGNVRGVAYTPTSASYNAAGKVLTLRYSGLPDDNYTLTLFSGDGRFEDVVGWDLDGEPVAFPIPTNQTGDGVEGGNFVVDFSLDTGTAAYPTPLTPKAPLGSLIYDPSVSGVINFSGDTDSFTLKIDGGQTLTALVSPGGTVPLYGGVGNGSFNQGSLLLVNQASGAGTFVGDPVTPGGLTGLAFDPSSRVLFGSTVQGFGSTSKLVRIDPATGALLATVGTITDGVGGPGMSIGDLAIQPGTGTLFGIRSNSDGTGSAGKLYTIDKTTGVAAFVGNTGSAAGGGIAFAPDGSLYQTAFDSGFDFTSLNRLDPATAARLSTVPIFTYFDGLAIRPSDGLFFAATGGSGDAIYTINPVTGAATFVGGTGAGSTSDLAFGLPALTPTVTVQDPSGATVGSGAAAPGQEAVVQTVPVPTRGTYTITVGGAPGTAGLYTLQVILNAAAELESHGGPSNNTTAAAQDLGPSFTDLLNGATRGAVLGRTDAGGDLYSFSLAAGQSVSAVAKSLGSGSVQLALLGPTGSVVATGVGGSPLANGSFETGDFTGWTTAVIGSPFVPWTVSPAGANSYPTLQPTSPQDGTFDAWNGFDGFGPMRYTMSQDVTIPAGSPVAQFSWKDRVQWDFALTGSATQPRTYEVEVLDPATNAVLATLFSFSTGTAHVVGDTGWQTHTADLSAFAGSTVRLLFQEDIPEVFTGPGQIEFDAIRLNVGGPQNVDQAISNYVAPAAGTYYVRITGRPGTDYSAVVTRDAVFDLESNNTLQTAQPLGTTHVALGYVGGPGDPSDFYSFDAAAGQHIHLFTKTPARRSGEFDNALDPRLRLYDASGLLIAEGTPLADGFNEEVSFTPSTTGTYIVEVSAEGGTAGEYYLDPSPAPAAAGTPASASLVSATETAGGLGAAGAPAVLTIRAPARSLPGLQTTPTIVSASGPVTSSEAAPRTPVLDVGLRLEEAPTGLARSVSTPAGTPDSALPAIWIASTTLSYSRPEPGVGASPSGRAAPPGYEGPAEERGLDEAGWGLTAGPSLAYKGCPDGGAAPGSLPAVPSLRAAVGVGLEEAPSCLAVDLCLADEDWVASLRDQGRPALMDLALGSAAMLAATGIAPQCSRDRQRAHLLFDRRE